MVVRHMITLVRHMTTGIFRMTPSDAVRWGRVQMYQEMASRHRVRASSLSIIKTATVPAKLCKRDNVKQFHDSKISFPLTHKLARCLPHPPCTLMHASAHSHAHIEFHVLLLKP